MYISYLHYANIGLGGYPRIFIFKVSKTAQHNFIEEVTPTIPHR